MEINIISIKHCDIDRECMNKIVALKQQHWNYSYDSQINWMDENIRKDDEHLCMKLNGELIAYLNLTEIFCTTDKLSIKAWGVGNVCVDKRYSKKGFGTALMTATNSFIKEQNRNGILLCHENLIPFYEKSGWMQLNGNMVITVAGISFEHSLMTLNSVINDVAYVDIDRNF